MKPMVDFGECLRDSPKFRAAIEGAEEDTDQLETKLEKIVKLCTAMVEAGKIYMTSKMQFINGIGELVQYFNDDTFNVNALKKLVQALQEMDKYQSILMDQAKRTICKNLNEFIQMDIKKTKDTKRSFEKYSDEYDQALIRNSQAPKSKQHECEDATNAVTAARLSYQHTALDYVFQISMLQAKKRHEVLDTLLSYTHAHSTFFHQGSDLCQDVDPFMKQLGQNLSMVREETASLEKNMEGRHALVGTENYNQRSPGECQLEGYLFKRTSNAFKTWKRRWFTILNNQLVYRKRSKDAQYTVMEEDLRLCTVKPLIEIDRRYCFEVLSPAKSHVLQADSEEMYSNWVSSLQASIDAALHHTLHDTKVENYKSSRELGEFQKNGKQSTLNSFDLMENKGPKLSIWEELCSIAGNDKCCDCGSPNPQWTSINLGITLCIECSGIHRSLGVHYSKVRSIRLDDWDADLIKLMKALGNSYVNKIYEAEVDETIACRPSADTPSGTREAWIKAKYVQKAFMAKATSPTKLHLLRKPNIRLSSHPRRPLRHAKTDASKVKTPEGKEELGISVGVQGDGAPVMEDDDKGDVLKGVKREKKYSTCSTLEEFHSKRSAAYFEDLCSSSASESSMPRESVPTSASEITESSDSGKMTSESENNREEYTDDEDEEDISPNVLLYRAADQANIKQMFGALAKGADINWVNHDDEDKSPVHKAIASGSVIGCEYLFLNGAKMDSVDAKGRTPLHFASDLGLTGQVCLLLKRGADQNAKDKDDKDALHYAVNNANADIVTLLRLARLNEEMKETEFGSSDETFNEVVRDFSQRASCCPERLLRPSVSSSGSS